MRLASLAGLVCVLSCSAAKFTTVSNPGFDASADSAGGDANTNGSDSGLPAETGCTAIDGGKPPVNGSHVECAMSSCDLEAQYCCLAPNNVGCVLNDAGCSGVAIQCVDSNNCQDQVCCANGTGTSCQPSCTGAQLCRTDCDCPNHDCQLYTCPSMVTFETCGGMKPDFCF